MQLEVAEHVDECLNFGQASHAHGKLVNLQMLFSRPGNVTEFCKITEHFGKVMKFDHAPYELAEFVVLISLHVSVNHCFSLTEHQYKYCVYSLNI